MIGEWFLPALVGAGNAVVWWAAASHNAGVHVFAGTIASSVVCIAVAHIAGDRRKP